MHDKKHPADSNLEASLRAIEDEYLAQLPERLHAIGDCLRRCLNQPANAMHDEALQLQLHSLAGSAGTFGLVEMGRRATALEMQLNDCMRRGADNAIDRADRFAPVAADIRSFLQWALAHPIAPASPPAAGAGQALRAKPAERLVYLVHDNALEAGDIAGQLQYFGYEVAVVDELARLQQHIDMRMPAAVVMDLGFPDGILAGAGEVARLRHDNAHRFAVIFLSTRSNFKARLATVRAGADGYFSKPLDMVALIDRLDALLAHEQASPYRILIVDDDEATAAHCAGALRGAGMDVKILHEVTALLHVMGEYRPELILMDIYMPECSGIDLAHLIRQDNMYLDVPIVFLSSEPDFEKQLSAIESGADGFLSKPIQPEHLVSSISSRARRYRALRGLIMRDSLTGLFNHSAIKEQLAREVARARRSALPLTLAMVDIDLFKQINDTYGHPVGDQVIRAVSRLLQQRLRRGDIIGRYGGEEFALIMPGTTSVAAARVLDEIRESFSKIRHYAEDRDFTATFSAGVAEIGPEIEADTLFRVADVALYQAKHDGRNCVRG